jgi:hypothetical protein
MMQERDLQEYLYNNPEVLFPHAVITEKTKEYSIRGQRIDLLFMVDGVRYIVELKSKKIERENIGQVIEYYGLMKEYMKETNLKMVLVAPEIPKWRSTFLEELGIRCLEINEIPKNSYESNEITSKMKSSLERQIKDDSLLKLIDHPGEGFKKEDFQLGVTPLGVAKVSRFLKDLLPLVAKEYPEFEITPYRITRPHQATVEFEYHQASNYGEPVFRKGNVWFAFIFGSTGEEPPNDVPNISVMMNHFMFEIAINSEIQSSQKVFINTIKSKTNAFNQILSRFDHLIFRTHLKYEHQPRFYHWILTDYVNTKDIDAEFIINNYREHEGKFSQERNYWVDYIIKNNPSLTENQKQHLVKTNKSINFSQRLSIPIKSDDPIWERDYSSQLEMFKESIFKLKDFILFFVK